MLNVTGLARSISKMQKLNYRAIHCLVQSCAVISLKAIPFEAATCGGLSALPSRAQPAVDKGYTYSHGVVTVKLTTAFCTPPRPTSQHQMG